MANFSAKSLAKLESCDLELIQLFTAVVNGFDCTILEGHRSADRQDVLFDNGKTQVKYPNSKHNSYPSLAVDVVPYPIDWNDRDRFHYFAGYVKGVASGLGINIRWGGDWDNDTETDDNSFDDLPHFEVIR